MYQEKQDHLRQGATGLDGSVTDLRAATFPLQSDMTCDAPPAVGVMRFGVRAVECRRLWCSPCFQGGKPQEAPG